MNLFLQQKWTKLYTNTTDAQYLHFCSSPKRGVWAGDKIEMLTGNPEICILLLPIAFEFLFMYLHVHGKKQFLILWKMFNGAWCICQIQPVSVYPCIKAWKCYHWNRKHFEDARSLLSLQEKQIGIKEGRTSEKRRKERGNWTFDDM